MFTNRRGLPSLSEILKCKKGNHQEALDHDEYAVGVYKPGSPGSTSISGGREGLAPKFASEILVGAPNFASKNISDKYPKFCPLNFRYDTKIGTFLQLLRLMVTELPTFFLIFGELGRTLPQILPPNLM